MRAMGLNEIREAYLRFFEEHDHLRLPSFPLVPQSDASLLLINSGMAPLKPYFSGEAPPPHPRVTTCQKCIRTPDIERVGKTSRHCTFFEMLGHFSFGDYFKREAIAWTWAFFTQTMGIDPSLLYCSVYLEDDESWDIWTKEIGVDPSHMARLGKEDNFWEIGAGPCGPCSEIYFDRGAEKGCGKPDCKVGCDCDRFVEVGNNVFTQFNNDGSGNYTPLAQKNIDFGMGLERLACVMQGVDNVFEVDTLQKIRLHVSEVSGVAYGAAAKSDVSLRVITDHIRSTVMLICDGVLPSNEGRGYVLRRLLRRAARHGKLLGIAEPFLSDIAQTVIAESRTAYPQLAERADFIRRVIHQEEQRFHNTLDAGLSLLRQEIAQHQSGDFSGETAFRLYDTYGFPLDLTLELLEEEGLSLDRARFDALMDEQRVRARSARAALGDFGWAGAELGLDKALKTVFTGYESVREEALVWAVVTPDGPVALAGEGQTVTLVLDKTPFYAEGGGQVADTGTIANDHFTLAVQDVKKSADGKYLHIGEITAGEVKPGDTVTALLDVSRRQAVMRAHSATHLLQKALREVLGTHVEQAGSLVQPDRVRFDFTHLSAVTPNELAEVSRLVNEQILAGLSIDAREVPLREAKEMGAMALFGEKYGDVVRVVRQGGWSIELCGGTHLDNTAKIGPFTMMSEASVAAGVRRIEAVTGLSSLREFDRLRSQAIGIAALFKTTLEDLQSKALQNLEEMRNMRRQVTHMRAELIRQDAQNSLLAAKEVDGLRFLTLRRDDMDAESLRAMGDYLRDKADNLAAVLASVQGEKITFLAVCGKQAVLRGVKAGDLVRLVSQKTGGKGGGKPDSAMGGGRELSKLADALDEAERVMQAHGKPL